LNAGCGAAKQINIVFEAKSADGSQLLLTEYSLATLAVFDVKALVHRIGVGKRRSSKHRTRSLH
jgi:hypothetical protein